MNQQSCGMKRQRPDDPTNGIKGRKKKRKDEIGISGTKNNPRAVGMPQKVASAAHAQPAEVLSGFQRMDEETTMYLTEVKAHLDTLEDREEISLLVHPEPCLLSHISRLVKDSSAIPTWTIVQNSMQAADSALQRS